MVIHLHCSGIQVPQSSLVDETLRLTSHFYQPQHLIYTEFILDRACGRYKDFFSMITLESQILLAEGDPISPKYPKDRYLEVIANPLALHYGPFRFLPM
jgi:hypothetical protein